MVESLLAQADLLNIAVGIEKSKGFFRLENPGSITYDL